MFRFGFHLALLQEKPKPNSRSGFAVTPRTDMNKNINNKTQFQQQLQENQMVMKVRQPHGVVTTTCVVTTHGHGVVTVW
jgi:hypothetical protein